MDALCRWGRASGATAAVLVVAVGIDAGRTAQLKGSIAPADAAARIARRAGSEWADVVAGSAVLAIVSEVNARALAALHVGARAAVQAHADTAVAIIDARRAVGVGAADDSAAAAIVGVLADVDAAEARVRPAVNSGRRATCARALKAVLIAGALEAAWAATQRIHHGIGADRFSRITDRAGGQVAFAIAAEAGLV